MGRSEILEVGAEGRVPPPGGPVNVGRTVETMGRRSGFSWAARSQLFRLRSRRERPTFCGPGGEPYLAALQPLSPYPPPPYHSISDRGKIVTGEGFGKSC